VDALAAARHPHGRPAIWAALLRLRRGTVAEISNASGAPNRTARSYLQALTLAGYVARTDRPDAGAIFELVAERAPKDPPRLRADGQPTRQGSGRDRLWRTMKMLRAFTARDLAVAASLPDAPIALEEAKDYAKTLSAAGYLATVKPGTPRGGLAVYRLVKNTGPQPPQIQRRNSVYDPNLARVVWIDTPEGGTRG
jgi:predicted ArsR family transcriptional regulator